VERSADKGKLGKAEQLGDVDNWAKEVAGGSRQATRQHAEIVGQGPERLREAQKRNRAATGGYDQP
jgi:hypothetical protein